MTSPHTTAPRNAPAARIAEAELFQHPTITALGAVLAERIAAKSAELP